MKKIICVLMIFVFAFSTTLSCEAYEKKNEITGLLAFGDSVVQGDGKTGSNLNSNHFGDQHFVSLLAQEYGLTNSTTADKWFQKYAVNGALMADSNYASTYFSSTNTIFEAQVKNKCPTTLISKADTVLLDGGINDASYAVGFEFKKTLCGKNAAAGESTALNRISYDDMVNYVTKYKNMTDDDVATYMSTYSTEKLSSWSGIQSRVQTGYDNIVSYLNTNGFTGTIYIQNNINPYSDSTNAAQKYLWGQLIDYCITTPINNIAEKYDNVVVVDLTANLLLGSKYTGVNYSYDSPDPFHMTFTGNRATYQYYSKLINPNANTIQFSDDTVPTGSNWRTLFDWENQNISNVFGAEIVNTSTLTSTFGGFTTGSNYCLQSNADKICIDLNGLDTTNIYGFKVKCHALGCNGTWLRSEFLVGENDRKLYYQNRSSSNFDSYSISVGSGCGVNNSFGVTCCSKKDVDSILKLNVFGSKDSTKTYDTVYVDEVYVYTPLTQTQVDSVTSDFYKSRETIVGDCNNDKIVDAKDYLLLKQYLAKWNVDVLLVAGDVNKDSVIDIRDLLTFKKYLTNIITEL